MRTEGTTSVPGGTLTAIPVPTAPVTYAGGTDLIARLEAAHTRRTSRSPFAGQQAKPEFTRDQLERAGYAVKGSKPKKRPATPTNPRHLEIARLYTEDELSIPQIAERLEITKGGVLYGLDRCGVKRDPSRKAPRRGIAIPTDTLRQLHVDQRLNCAQIGAMYGLSQSAIGRRLRDAGITRPKAQRAPRAPGRPRRADLDREQIVADYLANNSSKVVAATHGCSPHTVLTIVRDAGHTPRGAITGRPRNITLDKDRLVELYVDQGLSCAATATALNVSATTVRRNLKAHGIPRRDDRGDLITAVSRDLANLLDANNLTTAHVRTWAREQGHHIGTQGAIARTVIEDYLLAHQGTNPTKKENAA